MEKWELEEILNTYFNKKPKGKKTDKLEEQIKKMEEQIKKMEEQIKKMEELEQI